MSSTTEKDNQKEDNGSVEVHHAEVKGSEVLGNQDMMNDAFDGENEEHEEGVWAAFKKHPWACFWAFVMCFTIVSERWNCAIAKLTLSRSWNPSICS